MKAPRPRQRKLLLAVVLTGIAGLGGWVAILLQDEAPPDDSDLLPERREVPAEGNGFLMLDFTVEDVYWPEDDEQLSVESADFDVDAAREVVEKNAAILAKLDACLRRPEFDAGDVGDLGPYQRAWHAAAVLASCRALLLGETGRANDGLRGAVQVMKLGHRCLQTQQATAGDYLVAAGLYSLGFTTARRVLGDAGLEALVIREALGEVAKLMPSPATLQASLRGEYAWFLSLASRLQAGEPLVPELVGARIIPPFYYPHRTRRQYAEELRALLRNA
jgi:hypothetical protein